MNRRSCPPSLVSRALTPHTTSTWVKAQQQVGVCVGGWVVGGGVCGGGYFIIGMAVGWVKDLCMFV
jgi:hypothetical protein